MKELDLDTRFLSPLPQPMWGVACSHCDKPQARWEMSVPKEPDVIGLGRDGNKQIICSLCFLYDSVWGQERREALDTYIKEIENVKTEEQKAAVPKNEAAYLLPFHYAKDDAGRLIYATDGDRLLAAIAMANRVIQLQQRVVKPER